MLPCQCQPQHLEGRHGDIILFRGYRRLRNTPSAVQCRAYPYLQLRHPTVASVAGHGFLSRLIFTADESNSSGGVLLNLPCGSDVLGVLGREMFSKNASVTKGEHLLGF
jgi:hypothetical protein